MRHLCPEGLFVHWDSPIPTLCSSLRLPSPTLHPWAVSSPGISGGHWKVTCSVCTGLPSNSAQSAASPSPVSCRQHLRTWEDRWPYRNTNPQVYVSGVESEMWTLCLLLFSIELLGTTECALSWISTLSCGRKMKVCVIPILPWKDWPLLILSHWPWIAELWLH